MSPPILELRQVSVAFPSARGWQPVVDRVSLTVAAGERVGLVGESGSGKSITALAALGLVPPPGKLHGGSVRIGQLDLASATTAQRRQLRGGQVGLLLQEPATALHPVYTVGHQLGETLRSHCQVTRRQARRESEQLLAQLGLPAAMLRAYPHQLSGGQQQRIMLALAFAGRPRLLIADEPTTALDVTTQAQVLALVRKTCDELRMGLLLISHDLAVVASSVDRVIVLYAGEIVEQAPVRDLFSAPQHPYTRMLLAAVLGGAEPGAAGSDLSPFDPGPPAATGCRFAPRCPRAGDACRGEHPPLVAVAADRQVRCPPAEEAGLSSHPENGR